MVQGDYSEESEAQAMYAEIQDEAQKYPYSIPDEWIRDKFQELYLEAYIQNFTLNNPLKEKMVDKTF